MARNSVAYSSGPPVPYVGIENVAYTVDDDTDDETNEAVVRSYL